MEFIYENSLQLKAIPDVLSRLLEVFSVVHVFKNVGERSAAKIYLNVSPFLCY